MGNLSVNNPVAGQLAPKEKDSDRIQSLALKKNADAGTQQKQLISFGYNKNNDKFIQENGNDEIRRLNDYCNETEDYYVYKEKGGGDPAVSYAYLSAFLIPVKEVLANLMEGAFPKLNYRDTEAESYLDELDDNSDKPQWRRDLFETLQGIARPIVPYLQGSNLNTFNLVYWNENSKNNTPSKTGATPAQDENKAKSSTDATSNATPNQDVPKAEAKQDSGLLEKFVPGKNSPKNFKDVGGMDEIKTNLRKWIIDPQKPEIAKERAEYGDLLNMPNGFLLYGPPGCGKTYIVEALSQEADLPLYKLSISKIGSIYIHDTSIKIRKAFEEMQNKAKETGKPCILFLDEIDALAMSRNGMSGDRDFKREEVSTLLEMLNNAANNNIIVFAATNKINDVDDAILRTGRFDEHVFIGLPEKEPRKQVLQIALASGGNKAKALLESEDLDKLADSMAGLSNSDIRKVAKDAANYAFVNRTDINLSAFEKAMEDNKSLKNKDLTLYQDPKKSQDSQGPKGRVGYDVSQTKAYSKKN